MAPIPKRKTERAPAIDKLLKPAIGVAIALVAYYSFTGLDLDIERVDVTDELALREVLFGDGAGKNYAVLCHGEENLAPVSSVFQEAANEASVSAEFRIMDCNHVLESSGKSIADRFKLDLKKRPTIFVSGKVPEQPKQIPQKHLKTGHMLAKLLKQMLEPHAAKIETTKDLKAKCLEKEYCGLLLKGAKPEPFLKDAVANLLVKYPHVQFASIDATVLLTANLEEHLDEFVPGQHRFVVFHKMSGSSKIDSDADAETTKSNGNSSGRLITSIAVTPPGSSISFSTMSQTVQKALQGSTKKIPSLPTVKTRTKKFDQAEREKRKRKNQRTSGSSSSSSSSSGSSTTNDGSAEGRKAERERRRDEHNKNNNVTPKTPEELAELERQRRLRMEEEAAKWNIGAEDAGDEEYNNMEETADHDQGYDDEESELMDMDDH
eukprot:CAMPEP_0198284394 /NCGR_PEP_ID=MMETSP1449-20131203/3866_1 /TAXON_ID=420275 /ORGANISM="Attheya septentrionalis, Strain CCMP2084" /LENGTH=434 /DNA_ID=CAMNT_0043981433 /DNA_START=56 /DNA_END=1357 /DNA_ORIENTATION=+